MPTVEVWPNKHVEDQAPQDLPENFLHSISRGNPRKWESEPVPGGEASTVEPGPKNLSPGHQPSIAEAFAHAGANLLLCLKSASPLAPPTRPA